MVQYVLLMRHGEPAGRQRAAAKGEGVAGNGGRVTVHVTVDLAPSQPETGLSAEGRREVEEVAGGLKEALGHLSKDEQQPLRIGTIWYSQEEEVAKATAQVVQQALQEVEHHKGLPCEPKPGLGPSDFNPFRGSTVQSDRIDDLRKQLGEWQKVGGANAILVVGHQPLLGWMGHELTGDSVPMARAEVVCIDFPKGVRDTRGAYRGGHVQWSVAPTDEPALAALRDKIKSKMDVAKLLGAFVTTVLGFLLTTLLDTDKIRKLTGDDPCSRVFLYAALGCLFFATYLYFATMYAYDRLLMPTRFWGENPLPQSPLSRWQRLKQWLFGSNRPRWLVWRPPSSAVGVLFQNMVRIWRRLFMGATRAVLGGLFLLALAVLHGNDRWWAGGFFVVVLLAAWWWSYRHRPVLGTED